MITLRARADDQSPLRVVGAQIPRVHLRVPFSTPHTARSKSGADFRKVLEKVRAAGNGQVAGACVLTHGRLVTAVGGAFMTARVDAPPAAW
jgi:hypothetical protein